MPAINPSSGGTTRKDRLHEGKAEPTDTHSGIDQSIVAQLNARILFREVSRRQFRLFWILILCLRAGCTVFLYITTRIYFFISDPRMSYYAALVTPAGGPQLKLFGAAFATLAAVHCSDILKMLLCSLYSRDLAFEWPEGAMSKLVSTQMRLTSLLFGRGASSGAQITRAQWVRRVAACLDHVGRSVVRTINWLWLGLFHRTGIFGVESGYFHWRFLLREVSEIICQSIQVFSASQIVPSRTINRILLGVVVCNCLSTPIIQFCCQRLRTQNKVILDEYQSKRRQLLKLAQAWIYATRLSAHGFSTRWC